VSASAPHEADLGSLDLIGGAHELPLAVSGGDGSDVEIDLVTLTLAKLAHDATSSVIAAATQPADMPRKPGRRAAATPARR
jgi:hypothetical protein